MRCAITVWRGNPARPTVIPRPPAGERRIWSPEEAARFLDYCHHADPLFADLVEMIVGTGMRKGEALGLHWEDVDLEHRVLSVRRALTAVDNNHVCLGAPKASSSRNWVAISDRVSAALEHRARDQSFEADGVSLGGYVFTGPDGGPLRPGGTC
jgi:integrase